MSKLIPLVCVVGYLFGVPTAGRAGSATVCLEGQPDEEVTVEATGCWTVSETIVRSLRQTPHSPADFKRVTLRRPHSEFGEFDYRLDIDLKALAAGRFDDSKDPLVRPGDTILLHQRTFIMGEVGLCRSYAPLERIWVNSPPDRFIKWLADLFETSPRQRLVDSIK